MAIGTFLQWGLAALTAILFFAVVGGTKGFKASRARLKGIGLFGGSAVILLLVGIMVGGPIASVCPSCFAPGEAPIGESGIRVQTAGAIVGCEGLGITTIPTPTISVRTLSFYQQGTSITTENMRREVGTQTWIDIASGSTFEADVGKEFEFAMGIDLDPSETVNPYGPKIIYTIPCEETPTFETFVRDDSEAGDLSATTFDENGQVMSVTSNAQTIGVGGFETLEFHWTGQFREDFGNSEACGEMSNVLVARYNTSEYDDLDATDLNGVMLADATVPVIHGSSSGFTDKAWLFPVLHSTTKVKHFMVIDADATYNAGANDENITLSLYDSALYLDNDANTVLCGVEDEEDSEIGAAAPDTAIFYID